LYKNYAKNDLSYDFREPVPDSVLGYKDLIKNPMDLKTVQDRFEDGMYSDTAEGEKQVIDDINLIWDNCRAFNLDTSEIVKASDTLRDEFQNLLKKCPISLNSCQQNIQTRDKQEAIRHKKKKE